MRSLQKTNTKTARNLKKKKRRQKKNPQCDPYDKRMGGTQPHAGNASSREMWDGKRRVGEGAALAMIEGRSSAAAPWTEPRGPGFGTRSEEKRKEALREESGG